jgi:hypothetical protein
MMRSDESRSGRSGFVVLKHKGGDQENHYEGHNDD